MRAQLRQAAAIRMRPSDAVGASRIQLVGLLLLPLAIASCDRPAVPPPATRSHSEVQALHGQRVDPQPGETGSLAERLRKPSAGGRRVAVLGAGDSTGTKHDRAILAAEFDLFLNAREFTRARKIRPPPGICAARCVSLEDCVAGPRYLASGKVCEGGFCFEHACASGSFDYIADAVCIAGGGNWRPTLLCNSQADCEVPEWIRREWIVFGDVCLSGRCQPREECSPDWCRGDLPQSPHKNAKCEGNECVFTCKTQEDCVGFPNLPASSQFPASWFVCSGGRCRPKCTAETCNPQFEPAFHVYPKGMACTPEGGPH